MKNPTIIITITTLLLNNSNAAFLSCIGKCTACFDCISKAKNAFSEPQGQVPIINNNISINADTLAKTIEEVNAKRSTGSTNHNNSLSQDIYNIEMTTYHARRTEKTEHVSYSGSNQYRYSQTTTTTEVEIFESPIPQGISPFPIQYSTPQPRFSNGMQLSPIHHLIELPYTPHNVTPRHSYPIHSSTPIVQELNSPRSITTTQD